MLKQILIDADTGIDDSIAILFALKRPDVRVMGVTTGFGNTTARQAAENSLRLIRLAGVPYEVPVAVGETAYRRKPGRSAKTPRARGPTASAAWSCRPRPSSRWRNRPGRSSPEWPESTPAS